MILMNRKIFSFCGSRRLYKKQSNSQKIEGAAAGPSLCQDYRAGFFRLFFNNFQ